MNILDYIYIYNHYISKLYIDKIVLIIIT